MRNYDLANYCSLEEYLLDESFVELEESEMMAENHDFTDMRIKAHLHLRIALDTLKMVHNAVEYKNPNQPQRMFNPKDTYDMYLKKIEVFEYDLGLFVDNLEFITSPI